MKLNLLLQRGAVLTLILVEMIAAPLPIHAQTQAGPVDRFTATTVNVTGPNLPFRVDVLRWSTEAEGTQLLAALAMGEKDFATALAALPTQGYLWTSESAGYLMRFAFKTSMPDGTERIIVATDRRLGSWDPTVWKPVGNAPATDYTFSVVELRLAAGKPGEGKATVTTKVIADNDAKTVALDNYAAAPVVLKDVKRMGSGTSGN